MASSSDDEVFVILVCTDPNNDSEVDISGEEIVISTSDISRWDLPSILSFQTLKIQAHRNRLIEESSYFRGLLGGNFSESCLDCIRIEWQLETFLNVLKCMFCCTLEITSKNFAPLFQAALYFGVEALLLRLKSWFSEVSLSRDSGMFHIQLDDLINIWNFSSEHANGFVQELCASYFARNFAYFVNLSPFVVISYDLGFGVHRARSKMLAMSSECLKYVPYDLLLLCIKHPHLTVDSEKYLSDALLIWLDSNIEQLERLSMECGFSDILDEIRISLLPLWFAAGKRSSSIFSEFADRSVDSIFRLMQVPDLSINLLGDGDLSCFRIRLTEYSKRVDLSGCPQITPMVLFLSLIPNTHTSLDLRESTKEYVHNLEQSNGSKGQIPKELLPTLSFDSVQEVDISGCLKLHLEAAIECFSKAFPSLRKVKAAYLLSFKITTLYRLVQKCSLVSEVDITVDMNPLISSQVLASSSSVTSVAPNGPYFSFGSSSMPFLYHSGPSLSNLTRLTLEGRSDIFDVDIHNISEFCVSLCYLNLKGCILLTDACIANFIRRCTKLHSIVVCHTSFGINSIRALCTTSPSFSDLPTAQSGKKHLDSLASNLQLLHMGGCESADEASLLALLSHNQMLKSLCLSATKLVDDALCSFSGSLLEMLDVSNTMISGAALTIVVRANPGLKCLKARGCKNLFQLDNISKEAKFSSSNSCEEPFIELGKRCRLEEIALGWGLSYCCLQNLKPAILSMRAMTVGLGGSLHEDALKLLPAICPLLDSLVIYFQVISDCIIINIVTSLKQLQALALCFCLGDISISSFNSCMPNLRKLKLQRVTSQMTNDDLVLLTQNCPNLVELALLGCKLLNSDAQCIISHGWPGLISIHLEECGEVTKSGVCSLFNCIALEDLLLRHNGTGLQKNFILEAASKMPMLRLLSLDSCDASEGCFDFPDDGSKNSLRSVKIASCKFERSNILPHRVYKDTLLVLWDSKSEVRTIVKEKPAF